MMYSATSITSLFAWPSFQMPCCVLQSVQWSNVFLKHTVKEAAFKKLLMKLSGNANIHHRYLSFILRKPEEFFSKHLAVSSFVPVRQETSASCRNVFVAVLKACKWCRWKQHLEGHHPEYGYIAISAYRRVKGKRRPPVRRTDC
eukprot:1145836-Pelagomonas_calceolata.AAC.29